MTIKSWQPLESSQIIFCFSLLTSNGQIDFCSPDQIALPQESIYLIIVFKVFFFPITFPYTNFLFSITAFFLQTIALECLVWWLIQNYYLIQVFTEYWKVIYLFNHLLPNTFLFSLSFLFSFSLFRLHYNNLILSML